MDTIKVVRVYFITKKLKTEKYTKHLKTFI